MDIKKIKATEAKINAEARKEIYEDLSDTVINFLKDEIVDHSLKKIKTRNNTTTSARIVNNWIEMGIINVDQEDRGKTNRFSKEETIWLHLTTELRNFGLSLEKIKLIRHELFNEFFPSFTFIRFAIIKTIFGNDNTLIVFSDGTTKMMSARIYNKWTQKAIFPSHINVGFVTILNLLFPKNSFDLNIENEKFLDNINNIRILYFLKTGDFDHIKIEITKGDIRLIENSEQLINNSDLLSLIIDGAYSNIEVLSNGKLFNITT